MDFSVSLRDTIQDSFSQYAGAVIQSRALVDVRDCVKPSARQIYYCLYTDNFTSDKPFKKTLKAIGSSMRLYIHGDASCEGIIMRSAQPFSMRYPLVEVEGSYGNLTETGNWAAPRYTASRLSPLANYLVQDTDKYSIDEWADNYDDTEQYPRIFSSLGFYNIVNGSFGIAVGLASSIPQFNLKEVNEALIKLLKNPNVNEDEIICLPDFATGGIIVNKDEVIQSLKAGSGKACVIKSKIDYDKKDNCLIVSELPYGVYTNTICNEIEKLVQKNENLGIARLNDLTGEKVCIKIYLSRATSPQDMIDYLYQNTSLRSSYGINMTMLQEGHFPKIYTWKEALSEHLAHEKQVYIKCYKHQLQELQYKLKIVLGIIAAIQKIDSVIQTIKNSKSNSEANKALRSLLNIDQEQAKAILDMKLARLTKLEIDDFNSKKDSLTKDIAAIEAILNDEELLKKEMIKRFKEVIKKFGDERRTVVVQEEQTMKSVAKTKKEAIVEDVVVALDPDGYIKSIPLGKFKSSTHNSQEIKTSTDKMLCLFSSDGKCYRLKVSNIKQCLNSEKGTALGSILQLAPLAKINGFSVCGQNQNVFFATKLGKVKILCSSDMDSTTQNLKGLSVIKLADGDSLVSVKIVGDSKYVTLSTNNRVLAFNVSEINPSGKASSGRKGISLDPRDFVTKAVLDTKIESNGVFKIPIRHIGTKGIEWTAF